MVCREIFNRPNKGSVNGLPGCHESCVTATLDDLPLVVQENRISGLLNQLTEPALAFTQ